LLRGQIDDQTANEVIAKFLFLRHLDRTAPVTLLIDSPGGSVVAGLAIADTMDHVAPLPVHTHCFGEAHSMAALLLAHGTPGQRTTVPTAELSISMPWSPGDEESEVARAEVARLAEVLIGFAARGSGKLVQEVRADCEASRRFSAQQAVDYGLADRVEAGLYPR